MNERELKHLLRAAEPIAPTPGESAEALAARVRARYRRRRRSRVAATASAALLLAVGLVSWQVAARNDRQNTVARDDHPAAVLPAHDIQAIQAELAALDAEADFHRRVAGRMATALRTETVLAAARAVPALGDPVDDVRWELDRAAFRMLARAEDLLREPARRAEALVLYRDVIRLFPTTPSAERAREQVVKFDANSGGV